MSFSSPNPTFSACGKWVWTFVPFGLRGRDSALAWRRQYQYNLHSPLQPGVVKALLLVLRSSAALALAAVAPLCVAQFIRMRTARSPRRGSQPVCKSTACRLLTPLRTASIQNVCRLQALIEPQRSEGRDNKGANRHRGGSGGNFPRMRQPWRNTSASFAKKGGRGRRIAPHESNEPPAIKRGHTKSKIPPWRAPGCGGGVSPHKKSVTTQNIKNNRPQTANPNHSRRTVCILPIKKRPRNRGRRKVKKRCTDYLPAFISLTASTTARA